MPAKPQTSSLKPLEQIYTQVDDLYHLPTFIKSLKSSVGAGRLEFTLGDAHANPFKWLYPLIQEGILTGIDSQDYESLAAIYLQHEQQIQNLVSGDRALQQAATQQLQQDLARFEAILMKASFDPHVLVRYLGDELHDRGMNDVFMLILIKVFHQKQLPYLLHLSNHGLDFIRLYTEAKKIKNVSQGDIGELFQRADQAFIQRPQDRRSSYHLGILLAYDILKFADLQKILEEAYFPRAVLFSMTENCLYSHAIAGLETVYELLYQEKIVPRGVQLDKAALLQAVAALNEQFRQVLRCDPSSFFKKIEEEAPVFRGKSGSTIPCRLAPRLRLTWNRRDENQELNLQIPGMPLLSLCHGHTANAEIPGLPDLYLPLLNCLDDSLGAPGRYHASGMMQIQCSRVGLPHAARLNVAMSLAEYEFNRDIGALATDTKIISFRQSLLKSLNVVLNRWEDDSAVLFSSRPSVFTQKIDPLIADLLKGGAGVRAKLEALQKQLMEIHVEDLPKNRHFAFLKLCRAVSFFKQIEALMKNRGIVLVVDISVGESISSVHEKSIAFFSKQNPQALVHQALSDVKKQP